MPIVAIDGPGGAGKSTVALALAHRLSVDRLDTGAMYRAVTWAALDRRVDLGDGAVLGKLAESVELSVGEVVAVDGTDVTEAIRSARVTGSVSTVAAHPEVRRALVVRQREWVTAHGGGVVEGRDIASVVLPDADLKIFLTASPAERAMRRAAELGETAPAAIDAITAELERRDLLDSARPDSPLLVADGAIVIDTTGRSVDAVVDEIVALL